jgi:tRNA A-37 threonylcarbamoyl transferase component Bud32/tetratricopeptide (TPR) repeat protein
VAQSIDTDLPEDGEFAPTGCGRFPRESLELAAISRVDCSVEVDERISTHLVICKPCLEAVGQLAQEHTLLTELAQAARPDRATHAGRSEGAGLAAEEIPGYRLSREIHRGGQGAVYLAEQLATRRTCAVKMLLGGRFATPVQRMRFEREVEVVAGLRHPGIVTLYESGLSRDGEPWFAMEFVEGERLDEFVRRVGAGQRAIAELMRRVADTVAYAHRRGVIHRDLKPGNILVDQDGAPRILDFGLARSSTDADATDPRSSSTLAGEFVGTFAYAAPEQLAGDPTLVDSRCDLYALGVLFFELLAGQRPFEGAKSIAELVAQKASGATRRPSAPAAACGRAVDGDLDVIVLRLLAPDPARRYATAAALAEDLARYLDGRPILAREDSLAYVVTKTVRRHWFASGAAAVFLLTVVGASVALAVALANAEREKERVRRAYSTFGAALASANPEEGQGSSSMNVRDFLALVEKEVRSELADEPEVLAEMLKTLGVIQLAFDDPERSRGPILSAHEFFSRAYEAGRIGPSPMAEAELALARQLFLDRDFSGSEDAYRRAIGLRQLAFGPTAVETVDLERQLATVLRRQGRIAEAGALLEEALVHADRFPSTKEAVRVKAGILNGQAVLAAETGEHQDAIESFRIILSELHEVVPGNDFRRGRTLSSLAQSEAALGMLDSAERHAEEAVAILTERKGAGAQWTRDATEILAKIRAAKAAAAPR